MCGLVEYKAGLGWGWLIMKQSKLWVVGFIFPNELCERFSFFGTRALLNQYLKAGFGMSEAQAKAYVHLFNALVCLFPILGGAISDSYLGKFQTVILFSSLHTLGNVLMTLFSVDGLVGDFGTYPLWSFLLPTVLVALGSGCAKPCVTSHAGDQFRGAKGLDKFYAAYILAMNIGILLAVTSIPMLKDGVECFGGACYPLAYAVPALAVLLSLVIFACGRCYYRVIPPQGEFLPWKLCRLVGHALSRKMQGDIADDWLELAGDAYSVDLIQEARQFLHVVGMFVPLVFAWGLHEQNATEWQNQYEMMEKRVFGFKVPTEACSMYGAFLVIGFIPLVSFGVFPWLDSVGVKLTAGMRVAIGYCFVLSSFFISTILKYWVTENATNQVLKNNVTVSCEGCLNGAWQIPQWVLFSLGDAILIPACNLFAYSHVGDKMKAIAVSIIFLSVAMGNFVVIGLEPILSHLHERIHRQWSYVILSSIFFLGYVLLLKLWFNPHNSPSFSLY
ncbi:hypothetical protein DSO57_1037789 [Entomophthora muscae]|uniref:Uncharacterized protein n=1 Tax=Entomophthora muscae TaxID=34485 RepID=A0ACC2SZ69_9FUNG|nr:hypothetical protein DSO57_1037789 [Entomophthora muscae]